MEDIQFNTGNARIRTYEAQLLGKNRLERMLFSNSAKEAYSLLQETVYGDFIEENDRVHDFEEVLIAELKRVYETMYQLTPDKTIVDLFALRYDYQNLKVLVKSAYMKKDFSDFLVPIGTVSLQVLQDLVNTRKSELVQQPMVDCVQEVFSYMENYHEIQSLDIIFDNHYMQHLAFIGSNHTDQLIKQMVVRQIDLYNISAVLRSYAMQRKRGFIRAVMAEGGSLPEEKILETLSASLETFVDYVRNSQYQRLIESSYEEWQEKKTLNTFDLRKDNFLTEKLKEQKIVPFGPSAMLGYIYAKEIESKNLRIILVGKINNVSEDVLKDRMRESYE